MFVCFASLGEEVLRGASRPEPAYSRAVFAFPPEDTHGIIILRLWISPVIELNQIETLSHL